MVAHGSTTSPMGNKGPMFLEVFSRSFTIKVQSGLSLNQIRLCAGSSKCQQGELKRTHEGSPVLFTETGQSEQWPEISDDNSIRLSVNLRGTTGFVGYRAKKNSRLLDLSRINHYQAGDFWEPVFADRGPSLILEPEEFYLLASINSVSIPPTFAAEMSAYETATGELRSHYGGLL